jgi:hypothetical protein
MQLIIHSIAIIEEYATYYHGQLYRYTLDVYTWPFQFQNKSVPRKQTMNYRKVATSVGSFHNNFFNLKLTN